MVQDGLRVRTANCEWRRIDITIASTHNKKRFVCAGEPGARSTCVEATAVGAGSEPAAAGPLGNGRVAIPNPACRYTEMPVEVTIYHV